MGVLAFVVEVSWLRKLSTMAYVIGLFVGIAKNGEEKPEGILHCYS